MLKAQHQYMINKATTLFNFFFGNVHLIISNLIKLCPVPGEVCSVPGTDLNPQKLFPSLVPMERGIMQVSTSGPRPIDNSTNNSTKSTNFSP